MGRGQTILGASLGAHQHTFSSIFNVFLSRNLDQSMYNNGSDPRPCIVTPTYCYNFVVCVSRTKLVQLLSKQNKSNNSKCFAFAPIFYLLCSFCRWGRNSIFFLTGAGYPTGGGKDLEKLGEI